MVKKNNVRWTICALVFFATTVNYLDRAVISLLKSDLTVQFKWDDGDYANIEIAFKLTYALGMLGAGRMVDTLGTKFGYLLSAFLWSIAGVAHALVASTSGFIVVRSALGITESGNFPAAVKAIAEWFPKKERALATGIFNSGANVGAILAPLTVPFIAMEWGWKWSFVLTGSLGFVWVIAWFVLYEIPAKHKALTKAEFDYIHSDAEEENDSSGTKISWFKLLSYRQTWAVVIGKFMTDPVWWFYLFWLPDFVESQYGIKGTALSLPVASVFMLSTIGSVMGGWLPLQLMKRLPVFRARKISMLLYAFMALPIIVAQWAGEVNSWLAILIIGTAAAGHQAWSANMYTTASDMFPKQSVGSVIGIAGMFGALGGIFLPLFVQKNLFVHYRALGEIETAYYIMFFICGFAYISAWLVFHSLVPRMERVRVKKN